VNLCIIQQNKQIVLWLRDTNGGWTQDLLPLTRGEWMQRQEKSLDQLAHRPSPLGPAALGINVHSELWVPVSSANVQIALSSNGRLASTPRSNR